ncbi:MAG TPA: AgmX/PglI C-terminal domain-containing protein [Myxococcaceae bacterium]|nr:AgmX/PglI C-terminal domain-containing protein [Myxococcaceae bacterium]HZA49858.1 AgmX/PglI C-terminal domain-containing protein [Myxococcaceae bacterium]
MAAKNVDVVSESSGGDWLYRQEGLVLGPIPAAKIIEMLYAGQIDGRTDVAKMGSLQFRPLANEEFFRVHHAKSEAKRRVDAVAAVESKSHARRRNLKLGLVTVVALVLAGGAAFVARYFAIHNPWKDPDALAFADISVDPPTVTTARAHVTEEDLVDYPGAGAGGLASTSGRAAAGSAKRTNGSGGVARGAMTNPNDDPDGMQMAQIDTGGIQAVVASKTNTLKRCFVEESGRTPGLAAKIPLEFVIGNDGRVVTLWIDHPQFKTGPLHECLLRELQKWPFKAYEGERATVGLSFNIGKKR